MPEIHPTADQLNAFLLGKLGDADQESVEVHLESCPACSGRAGTLVPHDTLAQLLAAGEERNRRERSAALTPSPQDGPSALAVTGEFGSAAIPLSEVALLPAALAGHPRYRFLRPLGAGGMGFVWLAHHQLLDRTVAIKVIRSEILAHPGAVERFRREAQAVARLQHPNIVAAFDAEEAGGTHFFVMEYVTGENLGAIVSRGPLPLAEVCRIGRDVAAGLAHAHASGLAHRDIKPANLIRTPDGGVKILDFGLATARSGDSQLTGANVVAGTPDYIAPEQAVDAHAADARSDVYSLGCTLYHLIVGRVPFPGASMLQKLDAHRFASPLAIPGVPPALAALIARMMAKNPEDRPTAEQVVVALEPFSSPEQPARSRAPGKRRWPWLVAAGLAVLLFGTVAAVVYRIQRDNEVITIETTDRDLVVTMRRNGELIRLVDTKTNEIWELDAKKLRLNLAGGELSIDLPGKEPLVLRRDGDVVAVVRRQPLPFKEIHGADLPALREWIEALPAGGFRPVEINARGGATPPRFDAIAWRDGDKYPVKPSLELDRHEINHMTDFNAMQASWALRIVCTYDEDRELRRHHIWVKDERDWAVQGMNLEALPERFAQWKQGGFRPTKFYLNALDPGRGAPTRPYGVILGPAEGLTWEAQFELRATELSQTMAEARKKGQRPDVLNALGIGPNRTYAVSLVPNPVSLRWEFRQDMTVAQYEAALIEQKNAGLRPWVALSEGTGDKVRYMAVWVAYTP
jgi:tRNA A-37 threonylcarbamoyl transferase component Bud32